MFPKVSEGKNQKIISMLCAPYLLKLRGGLSCDKLRSISFISVRIVACAQVLKFSRCRRLRRYSSSFPLQTPPLLYASGTLQLQLDISVQQNHKDKIVLSIYKLPSFNAVIQLDPRLFNNSCYRFQNGTYRYHADSIMLTYHQFGN